MKSDQTDRQMGPSSCACANVCTVQRVYVQSSQIKSNKKLSFFFSPLPHSSRRQGMRLSGGNGVDVCYREAIFVALWSVSEIGERSLTNTIFLAPGKPVCPRASERRRGKKEIVKGRDW